MRCPRCHGCLDRVTGIHTTDGVWSGLQCVNCGACFDPVMAEHRRHRPEPYGVPIIVGHVPEKRSHHA